MKLWDFETGNAVFDFGEAHGEAAITCLDFDTTGRRCLTGGRDGAIKVWNYNNGHCLMTLRNREFKLTQIYYLESIVSLLGSIILSTTGFLRKK